MNNDLDFRHHFSRDMASNLEYSLYTYEAPLRFFMLCVLFEVWKLQLTFIAIQLSSTFFLLCSVKESHVVLEWHEGEKCHSWANYPYNVFQNNSNHKTLCLSILERTFKEYVTSFIHVITLILAHLHLEGKWLHRRMRISKTPPHVQWDIHPPLVPGWIPHLRLH